ncbi:MAG: hypothetical protein AB7H97_19900 [Pseudobdellovibrionaceae bacterium]
MIIKGSALILIYIGAVAVWAEPGPRSLRLIAVHPTYYYDVKETVQADEPLRKLVAEFQAKDYSVVSLVEPDIDLLATSCTEPRHCGLNYSTYLPGIEKTRIVESSQGENRIIIYPGETLVLAGGYFELCFKKAFWDLMLNALGMDIQVVFYLPAIYFAQPPRHNDLFTKLADFFSEYLDLRPHLNLKVKLQLGLRERTFGRGGKHVTVRVVNDLNKI